MQYIVADLEWNGGYSKKAHGYFNEIIEIGAVKLDEHMVEQGTFHAVIKPVVSRKLSDFVSDLTNIKPEELADGTTFEVAAEALSHFVGEEDAVLLTWSTTDLSVLMENYRFFLREDHIPFMKHFADLQAYCQKKTGLGSAGQQLGLSRACEALEIPDDGLSKHRALDDSLLTAAVAAKTFDPDAFRPFVREANDAFYDRLNFKPYYIRDLHNPLITPHHLRFRCPTCGRILRRRGEWQLHGQAFFADMVCRFCDQTHAARVQFRKKYDTLEVKRRLIPKTEETEPAPGKGVENKTEG